MMAPGTRVSELGRSASAGDTRPPRYRNRDGRSSRKAAVTTPGVPDRSFDAQSFVDPLFNGANISSSNNYNYALVNDPDINRELRRTNALADPAARQSRWTGRSQAPHTSFHGCGTTRSCCAPPTSSAW